MARIQVSLSKQADNYHFRATNESGQSVDIDDATSYEDGLGNGIGPMQMLVMAIGACSGIDIMSILLKSRQIVARFDIDVVGEKPDGVTPSVFHDIHISYIVEGDVQARRVKRAIELSLGKYCSVAATLEKTARITFDYSVNGEFFEGSIG